jgi:hypothetical protein
MMVSRWRWAPWTKATVERRPQERRHRACVVGTTDERRLRDCGQPVRMADRCRTQTEIASDLATTDGTVRRWLAAWRDEGLDGVTIQWGPGATPLIDEARVPEILVLLPRAPRCRGRSTVASPG